MRLTKGRPLWGAFVFLILGLPSVWQSAESATCPDNSASQPVSVASVTDGDTVVLSDRRRVRVIGMNALETSETAPIDRLQAIAATRALEEFLAAGPVRIVPGVDTHDRYGRLLAHLRLADGRDATHELVSRGLAIAVAIGKNTRCSSSVFALERLARQAGSGVWAKPGRWLIDRQALTGRERGFHVIRAHVVRITGRGRKRQIQLDNGLQVRLGKDWPTSNSLLYPSLDTLQSKLVEVRGWLGGASGGIRLTLHHPANLQLADN